MEQFSIFPFNLSREYDIYDMWVWYISRIPTRTQDVDLSLSISVNMKCKTSWLKVWICVTMPLVTNHFYVVLVEVIYCRYTSAILIGIIHMFPVPFSSTRITCYHRLETKFNLSIHLPMCSEMSEYYLYVQHITQK